MAQFDVFSQGFARDHGIPYIIVLQSDLLSPLRSVVVAPLRRIGTTPVFDRLTPVLEVKGEKFVLALTEIVHLPAKLLGAPLASLAGERDRIIAALDMLFTGI